MNNAEYMSIVFGKKISENINLVRVRQNGCFFWEMVKNNFSEDKCVDNVDN